MTQALTGDDGAGFDSMKSTFPGLEATTPARSGASRSLQSPRFGYQPGVAVTVKTVSRKQELAIALSVARFRSHLALPADTRGLLRPLTKHYDHHAEAFMRLKKDEQRELAPHLAPQWLAQIASLLQALPANEA